MIKILIADSVQIQRDCLSMVIESEKKFKVVACASTGVEAYEMTTKFNPDVVLIDLNIPCCSFHEIVKAIKNYNKNIKVLVLTEKYAHEKINDALKNSADGYFLKNISFKDMYSILKRTFRYQDYVYEKEINKTLGFLNNDDMEMYLMKNHNIYISFTPREKEVLELVVQGMTNEEIAQTLEVSAGRARNIVTELINKCMVKNRTQLAVLTIRASILSSNLILFFYFRHMF